MKKKTFKIWVEQVNRCCFEIQAKDANEAREKGYRMWRRYWGHSRVSDVVESKTPEEAP